ncbi:membrane-associated protease RseP (regulator of RpoE activity) [Lysinibacter cavernae]|uniref:Membrane-associated protease RseP (Regulator of RpoE activity) n=1 Tax=Lysinibacter cavernae TaxID=1640652 RepID=A0A7X5TT03_9MICO|nr:membrane-associated protease RseP (regulator of RpoE activity) [Lysinibacter cavernae]
MESVLLYILGVVIIVVGLGVSIGLHEIGHLVPAKLFGVKVTQYMIGFGKSIWKKRKGETEYGIKMIPLGGYISMIGMYPPTKPGEEARESTTGFLNSVVTEGTKSVHHGSEDGHSAAITSLREAIEADPKLAEALRPEGLHVETHDQGEADIVLTGDDAPAKANYIASMVEEARQASAETIGEGEDSRAFYRLPVWKRIIIMAGGPVMNLLLAILLYAILLVGIGMPQSSITVGSVSECIRPATNASQAPCGPDDVAAPGAAAGLLPGDTFVSINGKPISEWDQIRDTISDSPGTALDVVVLRDGTEESLTMTPVLNERAVANDDGTIATDANGNTITEEVGMVGMSPTSELVRQPVTAVLPQVGDNIGKVVHMIVNLPSRMVDIWNAAFGSEERDPNGPMSVVGVGRVAGEIASLDTVPFVAKAQALIGMLASLNVMLFIFNLIPLMPLDGGHIIAAVYERIRRTLAKIFKRPDPGPVDAAKMVPITFGVVLIMGAMTLLLVYADIVKPVNLFG